MPLFSFFSHDEYSSSLTAAVKIPGGIPGGFSCFVSGYVQATFYFTEKNYLRNGFEGSFEDADDWKLRYTLVWRRNATDSLAKGIAGIFRRSAAGKITGITKTDSLNMSASCASPSSSSASPSRRYSLAYTHETETQVTKYISINTDVGASYYADWGKTASLTATATLGATVRF